MKYLYIKIGVLALFFTIQNIFAQEQYSPDRRGEIREVTINLPNISEPQTLRIEIIDGLAIIEGDIVLGPIESLESGRGGTGITVNSEKWTNATIPYEIDTGSISSSADQAVITQAINEMNTNTNLTLRPKTQGDTDYVRFINEPVRNGYASSVGRMGNVQAITVKTGGNHPIKGKIMHEIGHAAGLYHEHTRRDRDNFIRVDFSNIHPGIWRDQYRKYTSNVRYGGNATVTAAGGEDVGNYDYGSIMHYADGRNSAAARNPTRPIITTIPPGRRIGQRSALSAGDIRAINAIYSASGNAGAATTGGTAAGTTGTSNDSDSSSDEDSAAIDVSHSVQLVPQTTSVSCWAAAAAMVVGWREHYSMTPDDIARPTGGWQNLYSRLPADNTDMFSVWGLRYEHPQSRTVEAFAELMQNGPLWTAADVGSGAHVVVVSAIRGDGTPDGTMLTIQDPLEGNVFRPSNSGSTYQKTYREFTQAQETLARAPNELSQPVAFYIAY